MERENNWRVEGRLSLKCACMGLLLLSCLHVAYREQCRDAIEELSADSRANLMAIMLYAAWKPHGQHRAQAVSSHMCSHDDFGAARLLRFYTRSLDAYRRVSIYLR
jgi:hypothetical protein